MDLTGIDIGYRAKLARHAVTDDPRDLPSRTVTELVERGELGRKTGKGFYTYEGAVMSPDYYLLDELLTDEARDVRDRVRTFVDTDLLPVINDYWDRAEFPFALVPKIAELGIIGSTIEGYGCPGLSRLAAGMVTVEMSRGDGSINTFIGVQSGLAMGTINLLGSEEQKQRWLPGMATLDKIGAFALTEPDHGSDSVALETTARRDGDAWVLNGAKRWIGNASIADVVVVWARDIDDGKVKAIVVEKNPDGTYPDGYTTELITGKIGKRAVWQPDVTLRDVRVPLDNKLAEAHSFRDATRVLTATRGGAAWESLGHAVAAYEIALDYAKTRKQFGRPIASFQLVQAKLAEMLAEITGDAAVLLPDGAAAGAGPVDRADGVAGEDEPRPQGAPDLPGRPRHPRRQRAAAGEPRRPPPHRHGGGAHLRGHRQHPGTARRPRHHGDLGVRMRGLHRSHDGACAYTAWTSHGHHARRSRSRGLPRSAAHRDHRHRPRAQHTVVRSAHRCRTRARRGRGGRPVPPHRLRAGRRHGARPAHPPGPGAR